MPPLHTLSMSTPRSLRSMRNTDEMLRLDPSSELAEDDALKSLLRLFTL